MKSTYDTAHGTPSLSSKTAPKRRRYINWHEAARSAVEIELRDYAGLLEFDPEYSLGDNYYRIDLLVIIRQSGQIILKNIARIFKTCNLFECKGIHSSLTVNSYYKTIGYAGLLIDQLSRSAEKQYSPLNTTISFLTFHYPMKLIKHLTEERHLTVEKISKGIYDISMETFSTQIIVITQLPPDENLYLSCLTDNLQDASLIKRLSDDYKQHREQEVYINYMNQLTTANTTEKGGSAMVCEGLFNLYGTSSAEIIANATKESQAQIREQSETIKQLSKDKGQLSKDNRQLSKDNRKLSKANRQLSSQNNHLKKLLRQNNISFE